MRTAYLMIAALCGVWARWRSRNNTRIERIWFKQRGLTWLIMRRWLIYRSATTIWLAQMAQWGLNRATHL